MSDHLINIDEFKELTRAVSVHVEEREVMAFVDECEQMYIIPAIGYGLFKRLVTADCQGMTADERIMLDGGEWQAEAGGGPCGCGARDGIRYCKGVRSALAYFVYAKMLMADGAIVARSGAMRHNDAYASHIDPTKVKQYNDVMDVAESYLGGVAEFIKFKMAGDGAKKVRGTRCKIHAIGD